MRRNHVLAIIAAGALPLATPAIAQVRLDRADPTIAEQTLPRPTVAAEGQPATVVAAPATLARETKVVLPTPRAIIVVGNAKVPTEAFAPALAPFLGRTLDGADLSRLAGAIAAIARQRGYPFASATVEPQSTADGVLRVTLDEGRISAVRVIGASNPLADRLLSRALVTDGPVRQATLERAILEVGDIAGVTVTDSRYVRENGFGILLVTIAQDRATAYAQIDNRGSREIGPLRETMLASLRGVAQSGDDLRLVAATTPLAPHEFAFLRAAYAAPVDLDGGLVTVSASVGRANPGGWLKPLDIVGNSVDAAVAYATPLVRSRVRSIWASVELRALRTDQTLLGGRLRDDRIATATASLNGTSRLGPGTLSGEAAMVVGLPLAGVTHQGDPYASRPDGDARFVSWGYTVGWTAPLAGPLSVALASAGQLASRPLLATAQLGIGGPAFGRAYDYAERTGDRGVVGSAELRASLGRIASLVDRTSLYGFVDGGYVDMLHGGGGGGALASSGAGARLGRGALDGMVEIAFPLNADRYDTGSRAPRLSFRLARSF